MHTGKIERVAATIIVLVLLAVAGCDEQRDAREFEPGTWVTEDGSASIILRGDGTMSWIGIPTFGRLLESGCADGGWPDPVTAEGTYTPPHTPDHFYFLLDSPNSIEDQLFSGPNSDWSELHFYPCDPDRGAVILFRAE